MTTVWRDGAWIELDSLDQRVFEEGDGLFETVLVREGRCALLVPHLQRLYASAERFHIGLPELDSLAEACRALPTRLGRSRGRMRILVDRGEVTVAIVPFDGYPEVLYQEGACVQLAPRPGHPLGASAGEKVLPYAPLMRPRAVAEAEGAVDIVFWDQDGALLEGSGSNLFVVIEGQLRTPPLTRRILPGIIRQATLDAAREAGLDAVERDVFLTDLPDLDEAFVTSSLREVMPLRRLGDRALAPGPVARMLLDAVRRYF